MSTEPHLLLIAWTPSAQLIFFSANRSPVLHASNKVERLTGLVASGAPIQDVSTQHTGAGPRTGDLHYSAEGTFGNLRHLLVVSLLWALICVFVVKPSQVLVFDVVRVIQHAEPPPPS